PRSSTGRSARLPPDEGSGATRRAKEPASNKRAPRGVYRSRRGMRFAGAAADGMIDVPFGRPVCRARPSGRPGQTPRELQVHRRRSMRPSGLLTRFAILSLEPLGAPLAEPMAAYAATAQSATPAPSQGGAGAGAGKSAGAGAGAGAGA